MLKSADLHSLQSERSVIQLKKGMNLYLEDSVTQWLYCIYTGKLKIHKACFDGKPRIIRFVGAGDIIGQFDSLGDNKHSSSATAIEESIICLIPKKYLTSTLNKQELHLPLVNILSSNIKELEWNMLISSVGSAMKQVTKALVILEQKFGLKEDGKTLDIYLTRKEFGEFLGISTETIIRVFSEMQKQNLVQLKGKNIAITDINYLKKLLY
jgi:CRP/FNR family transcriptional regulator